MSASYFPPDPDAVPSFDDVLAPESVRLLAERGVRRGLTASFQSLLAASVEAVAEAVVPVRAAEAAAINLAQQQHVAAIADRLDAVEAALRGGLNGQGRALLPGPRGPAEVLRDLLGSRRHRVRVEPAVRSWGEAMVAAVDALAEAAEYTATLAAAQPENSSARILGEGLAERLEQGRDALVDEAARTGG